MEFDHSGAERFLSYVDGDRPLDAVWDHPAYRLAREHAELLDRDLTREDIERALDGETTTFSNLADLSENRERIAQLRAHVDANEDAWTARIERALERVVPDADLSAVTLYLAVGYSSGLGLADGAYLNLNEPLFHRDPRQLLYTACHEASHVVYERVHGTASRVTPDDLRSRAGQRRVFETVFHTEAYATYAPLELRREDGVLGEHDHPISEDYAALSDEGRLEELVAEYDSVRERLRTEALPRETLLSTLFGGRRLPYRVGCALLAGIERREGEEAVRDAFHLDAAEFVERYDRVLDDYRGGA